MNSRRLLLSSVLLPMGLGFAQQTQPVNAANKLAQYPFGAAAKELQTSPVPPLRVTASGERAASLIAPPAITPMRLDIPVSAAGKDALAIAKQWQGGDPVPTAGSNGIVQFAFGTAMPPIVCGPERQTLIFLQPGERLTHAPVLGDSSRWEALLLRAGQGDEEQTVVAIKFRKAGSYQTDLVLPTNRRVYQLNLQTNQTQYLSQVAFTYPDDPTDNWKQYEAEQGQEQAAQAAQREESHVASLTGPTNFNYTVKYSKKQVPPFVPKAVYDDGSQTFFKMPGSAQHWDAAVLQIAGPDGCEVVNHRLAEHDPDTWIVDRLFNQAELVSGTGKHAERVIVRRDGENEAIHCGKNLKGAAEVAAGPRH